VTVPHGDGGGGGIGSPPSAVRVEPCEAEELGPVGGGIGSPPSARSNLVWPEEAAEWYVTEPNETTINANTANKLVFRKFISPPNFW